VSSLCAVPETAQIVAQYFALSSYRHASLAV
jgi:hypothetical protein